MSMRPRAKKPAKKAPDSATFPPEVWLQVFPYLSQSGSDDVKSVTLVSQSFRVLAQPLLFRRITFRPQCIRSPTSGRLMSWHADLERIQQRVAFFTLERINHNVHAVEIEAIVKYGRREEGTVELGIIVDDIFRVLYQFPHLLSLRCAEITFSPEHIDRLLRLPVFDEINAVNCHISASVSEQSETAVMVKNLEIVWGTMSVGFAVTASKPESHSYWLSFMHPDVLRRLSLMPLSQYLHQMLFNIVQKGTVYRSLQALKCPWYSVESPYFFDLLAQFPFLQELRLPLFPLHRNVVIETQLPANLIPNLTVLEAPETAIPLFVRDRPVRELSFGTATDTGSDSEHLLSIFYQIPTTAEELETITIYPIKFTEELSYALATQFPKLKSLNIFCSSIIWGPTPGRLGTHNLEAIMVMLLSLQLPSALQYLCIGKEYTMRHGSWDVRIDGEDVLPLKSYFLLNYPNLREMHFYSANIQLDWSNEVMTTSTRPPRVGNYFALPMPSAVPRARARRLSF